MKSRVHPFFGILILLAVIGFFQELIANPINLLVIIGLSALLFYLVNNYMKSGRFLPWFRVQKPKQPTKMTKSMTRKTGHSPRKENPFRVIEGSKGKTKQSNEKEKEPKMYQ
ncbi:MAG TPA: hypothetical protein VE710_07785 [Candidatus Bathyarchaeia archaeon]|nr:hypothetical protein [Candidatus Bathyarchaeia archaeon]